MSVVAGLTKSFRLEGRGRQSDFARDNSKKELRNFLRECPLAVALFDVAVIVTICFVMADVPSS
ncbi:hypothetical protein [Ectopseudomonas alcaliphila]|uniref:hypothetical protein n=1 Tax=Ectopseudomonas alcaliphila TaxID=101564 RepID=UPI00278AB7B2|nr:MULTISPECIES: hypothetical protein [Pseudomonas]MDP9939360.1 hypothetical protein [Pseudomonas sp. 3400]MDR7013073.1 hypothetical protein [Pseudomonas alcaliphila]